VEYKTELFVKMHCRKLCSRWLFRNSPYEM